MEMEVRVLSPRIAGENGVRKMNEKERLAYASAAIRQFAARHGIGSLMDDQRCHGSSAIADECRADTHPQRVVEIAS